MKIYVINYKMYDDIEIGRMFLSKEKAEKFCELRQQVTGYTYWVEEEQTSDDIEELFTPVNRYYFCDVLNTGKIRTYPSAVNLQHTEEYFIKKSGDISRVYSSKSIEHAKEIASSIGK